MSNFLVDVGLPADTIGIRVVKWYDDYRVVAVSPVRRNEHGISTGESRLTPLVTFTSKYRAEGAEKMLWNLPGVAFEILRNQDLEKMGKL